MSLLRETPEASLAALRELFEAGGIRLNPPAFFGLDLHCPEVTYSAELDGGDMMRVRLYGEGCGRPTTLGENDVDTTHHILAVGLFAPKLEGQGSGNGLLFGVWIVDDEIGIRMGEAPKENDVVLTEGPEFDFIRSLRDQANKARYKSFEPVFEAPATRPRP